MIKRSSAISNGTFRTYKHPDHDVTFIAGESNNELNFLRFAELDPNVEFILGQPTELHPVLGDKLFQAIPDFAIMVAGHAKLIEVKGSDAYDHHNLRRKLAACEQYAESAGWTYRIVLGGDLFSDPLYDSITALWTYHRRSYNDLHLHGVLNYLWQRDAKVGEVVATLRLSLGDNAPRPSQVLSIAAGCRAYIDLDPRVEVGEDSLVRFPDPRAAPPTLFRCRSPSTDLKAWS